MYNIELCKLKDFIQKKLTQKRMRHTQGVISEAKTLAARYGVDVGKAEFAALCHDMARCKPAEEWKADACRLALDPRYCGSIELAHAKIAAELLKREWGMEDLDILNAVAYHTTGRPEMSMLEKVIYLADAIEPGRDYPEVERLRELAYEDLNKACMKAMDQTIEYVNRKGYKIDEDTLRARDDLLAKERRADEQ